MNNAPLDPNFVLLYVQDPARSVAFYREVLGCAPVESSPNFALFVSPTGAKLGLWARHDVQPEPLSQPGAHEVCFAVPDTAAVNALHAQWAARGVRILQAPTQMDFGFTFTAADPDGHRLRVYTFGANGAA